MVQLKREVLFYGAIFAAVLFISMAAVLLVSVLAQSGTAPQATDSPSLVILSEGEEPALLIEQGEEEIAVLLRA